MVTYTSTSSNPYQPISIDSQQAQLPQQARSIETTVGDRALQSMNAQPSRFITNDRRSNIASGFDTTANRLYNLTPDSISQKAFDFYRRPLDQEYERANTARDLSYGSRGFQNSSSKVLADNLAQKEYLNTLGDVGDRAFLTGNNLFAQQASALGNQLSLYNQLGDSPYNQGLNEQQLYGNMYNNMIGLGQNQQQIASQNARYLNDSDLRQRQMEFDLSRQALQQQGQQSQDVNNEFSKQMSAYYNNMDQQNQLALQKLAYDQQLSSQNQSNWNQTYNQQQANTQWQQDYYNQQLELYKMALEAQKAQQNISAPELYPTTQQNNTSNNPLSAGNYIRPGTNSMSTNDNVSWTSDYA